ncbi:MAG TPA: hypothetical protein VK687_12760, partial [Bryobacteraceae bacterium]|nr:hypothetical protein [Bryobacteraceae bacterium]
PASEAQQTDEERAYLRAAAAFRTAEMDYFNEQQHKPETVSFVLADSPLGAAAWIIEKFKGWSDSGDNIESTFTKDQLLRVRLRKGKSWCPPASQRFRKSWPVWRRPAA